MLSGQSFILSVVVDHYKQPETLTASNASLEYVCRFQVRTVTSVVHTTPIVETLTLGVLRAPAHSARVRGYECVLASVLMDNLSVAYAAAI